MKKYILIATLFLGACGTGAQEGQDLGVKYTCVENCDSACDWSEIEIFRLQNMVRVVWDIENNLYAIGDITEGESFFAPNVLRTCTGEFTEEGVSLSCSDQEDCSTDPTAEDFCNDETPYIECGEAFFEVSNG